MVFGLRHVLLLDLRHLETRLPILAEPLRQGALYDQWQWATSTSIRSVREPWRVVRRTAPKSMKQAAKAQRKFARSCSRFEGGRRCREAVLHDLPVDIGQSPFKTVVVEGQPLMVESH